MRFLTKDLMNRLGVGRELGPYETAPWSAYDPQTSATCSAEARMDPDGKVLEAEIQVMYDPPLPGKPPVAHVFMVRIKQAGDGKWDMDTLRVQGVASATGIYNWQEKSCNFFRAVVQELQSGKVPDIEAMIDHEFYSRDRFGDQRQGGGGKSPKMKGAQLLGIKRGGSF